MNLSSFMRLKNERKIVAITAYDALFAGVFDEAADMILVGDSLSMSFGGEADTIAVGMEAMLYHTKAVRRAVKNALLVADMPFGADVSIDLALKNATRFYKEAAADAVKLEVNAAKVPLVRALCENGFAVMPHIGLLPQFCRFEGGYKIKGKSEDSARELLDLALSLQDAGAFSILIEGVRAAAAAEITRALKIPTIGIGSGVGTDGQILVWSDAFGFFDRFSPKFVRKYLDGRGLLREAFLRYAEDVRSQNFPNEGESY